MNDTPVYLVCGFLESGKTTFIRDTLRDPKFCSGEKVLVIACEEGEEELDPSEFGGSDVFYESVDKAEDMSPELFIKMQKKHGATKILIEYNGMWQLSQLYNAAPENWIIGQQILFFDAASFISYNANMRSLVVDKIQTSDMIVFNRITDDMDVMEFHKIVRGLSRQCAIIYEKTNGDISYDEIEDPLPYDMSADVVEIADRDYAIFYRDLCEKMADYDGKTVKFKAIVAKQASLGTGWMFVGRHVMTCCAEDIRYSAMVCKWPKSDSFENYDWVSVQGKIQIKKHKAYESEGPVLIAEAVEKTSEPEQPVAVFY